MALIDIYHAALADSQVKQRFIGAVIKSAAYVLNEDPLTPNHVNRLAWAMAVKADPLGQAAGMWTSALTNATVIQAVGSGGEITDNDIEYVVAVMLDEFANALAAG